jgi:hypothetical protein
MSKEWSPNEGWIQTYTGKKFYLTDPTPDMVCLEDIAHALSMQCRFAGHTKQFYSVAQHSILVANLITEDELKIYGLLHDASETYLVDIPKPLKQLIPKYKSLEIRAMKAIAAKFNLSIDSFYDSIVTTADLTALRIEAKSPTLFDTNVDNWAGSLPDTEQNMSIISMEPKIAKDSFLRAAGMLGLKNHKG